jgi:hypothetical protein
VKRLDAPDPRDGEIDTSGVRCRCGLRVDATHTPETCDLAGGAAALAQSRSGAYGRRLPMVRGECEAGPRPCPHTRCRHNLTDDRKGLPYLVVAENCALDVVVRLIRERDEAPSLREVAQLNAIGEETARRAEASGMAEIARRLGIGIEDVPGALRLAALDAAS